jgi:proteic killer suppression protein
VIRSIRHRGLKRLYDQGDAGGLFAEHVAKLRDILARLDAASSTVDMDLPGFRLHALKGDFRGFWAVTVRANCRVVFRFDNGDVVDVDYLDYQ